MKGCLCLTSPFRAAMSVVMMWIGGAGAADGGGGVHYDVRHLPGGIDRVILSKRDDGRNLCIQVTLASPSMLDVEVPAGQVDLPTGWAVERAFMVRNAAACRGLVPHWPEGAIHVAELSGSVRWGKSPTEKTVVDLRLSFAAEGSKPAFTERLAFKR